MRRLIATLVLPVVIAGLAAPAAAEPGVRDTEHLIQRTEHFSYLADDARDEPAVASVGMAKPRDQTILLTSYHDATTGRTTDEYMRVACHELVHVLMPHDRTWLQEGLALFLAGQQRDFVVPPRGSGDIKDFIGMNITDPEAYGYYGWLTRFIIQRSGLEAYLEFYRGESYDFGLIGYRDVDDFCSQAYRELERRRRR
jgi:hypothetical protein